MEFIKYLIGFQIIITMIALGAIIYFIIKRRRNKGLERFEKRDY
jgi:preprotein translocase subunit YajC